MNISSLLQSTDYYDYYRNKNSANNSRAQSVQASEDTDESTLLAAASDPSVGKPPPPPPESADFENMSDEDLRSYLTKMQEWTGGIPGTESGTTVEDLSDEELAEVRGTLIEMSEKAPALKHAPASLGADAASLSDEDLLSLLEAVKSYTGSVPGAEDSDALEVSDLNEEQLAAARDAIAALQQERFQSAMRRRMEEMQRTDAVPYALAGLTADA